MRRCATRSPRSPARSFAERAPHPDRLGRHGAEVRSGFHEAIAEAASLGGFEGYAPKAVYRRAYEDGRIRPASLRAALVSADVAPGGLDRPLLGTTVRAGDVLEHALLRDLELEDALAARAGGAFDPLLTIAGALEALGVPAGLSPAVLGCLARTERRTIRRLAELDAELDLGAAYARATVDVLATRAWLDVFAVQAAASEVGVSREDLGSLLHALPARSPEFTAEQRVRVPRAFPRGGSRPGRARARERRRAAQRLRAPRPRRSPRAAPGVAGRLRS